MVRSSSSMLFPSALLGIFLYAACPKKAAFLPGAWSAGGGSTKPTATDPAQEATPIPSRRHMLAGAALAAAYLERHLLALSA
ncbi:unnamed protein product [Symbiodinium natans]|uniref:Secreted protein n=1 Tax=Symbiodinium natans TaxID=878477 RepID=A0A812SZV8_9DINO|nr:unnamed protein product [Symbiodinium natans]